jgi:hypothetical protein
MNESPSTVSKTSFLLSGENKAFQRDGQFYQTLISTQSQMQLSRASTFLLHYGKLFVHWQVMLGGLLTLDAAPGSKLGQRGFFANPSSQEIWKTKLLLHSSLCFS